jgi:hypothetical protein
LIQVAIMGSRGRPRILAATLARLVGAGALFSAPLARPPRIYFAGELEQLATAIPEGCSIVGPLEDDRRRFDVVQLPFGPPLLPQFWRVFLEADPTADLLFVEDDVWIVEDGVPRLAALELPEWAGAVSFFDFRNEGPDKPPFWPMPIGRDLWGTQCVKVPAAVVAKLAAFARREVAFQSNDSRLTPIAIMNSWDGWLGRAVEAAGFRMTLHTPSLVQHLGSLHSAISTRDHNRPVALNFPEPWPTIMEDEDVFWCSFHGTRHEAPNACPETEHRRI